MSQFIVSARKYRPTSFDEVIGQDHVAKTLKNALQTDHLAHAFLFTGPRGVGKTTCARILAKIINCENPVDKVQACNLCSSCLSFNDNASFNIFELDAASNNSVENIRSLIDQVRIQPQHGRYKVFIIDEVHMLSSAAFNAFLKTLEEPPAHAIFILATTEKHKIIPTILSRCQIFDFRRIQISDAVHQLKMICQEENIEAEEEALHTIAVKADGAMRDALTIFDKIKSSIDGKTVTYKDVVSNLNLLDYEYYFRITDAMIRQDIGSVLLSLNEIVKQGFDPEHFVVGLAEHFRDLLIARIPATLKILEGSDELKKRYYYQASLANSGYLLTGLNILNQTDINLSRSKNKRLQVEVALSKITFLSAAKEADVFNISKVSQEKKTELSNDIEAESTLQYIDNHSIINKKDEVLVQDVNTRNQQPETKPVIETQPNLNKSSSTTVPNSGTDSPKITNLSAIRDQIKAAEKSKAKSRENLSLESVIEIWEDYTNNNPSKSVQTALKMALLNYSDYTVFAKVPAQVTKDIILHEAALIDRLREELGVSDLRLDIEVDSSSFPEFEDQKPIQAMTQREKYMHMLEKNKAIGLLTQTLGLKLDSEL